MITSHHDGHGLTETILVEPVDAVGPGGAHHRYAFHVDGECVGWVQFQKGPRNEPGSTTGVLTGAVLAMLIDIVQDFQSGPFPCHENELVLGNLTSALFYTKQRAHERASRSVLGYNKP